jgi:FkbM family methyltransferase
VALAIREGILRHYLIPASRYGVAPGLVRSLPSRKPITLVDVGASVGEFAAGIQKQFGLRRALLIEPQPERCGGLRETFAEANVRVVQCALSDRSGEIDLDILNFDYSTSLLPVLRDEESMSGGFDLAVRERIKCRTRTLDDLLEEEQWHEPVDLLKLDVQGAELMVLGGAANALANTRMVCAEVSFRPLYLGSCTFAEVYASLRNHGFRLLSLEEGFKGTDGELLQADALFSR